jgi:hypothetical protein
MIADFDFLPCRYTVWARIANPRYPLDLQSSFFVNLN